MTASLTTATLLAAVSGAIVFLPLPHRAQGAAGAAVEDTTPPTPSTDSPRIPRSAPDAPPPTIFPVAEYLAGLTDVRSRVRILDTFPLPHTLTADYRRAYLAGLRTAVDAGARVQILLLHARSAVLNDRVNPALGQVITPEAYRTQIHRAMADLDNLRAALPAGRRAALQIRLTDAFPAVTCYQLDDRVLTAFYPPDRPASEAPHAWVRKDSPIGNFARDRFTNLWEHAEDLDLPRQLFCEIQLDTDPDGPRRTYPRTRFVERGSRLYVCFESRNLRDRAFDERFLYARLPDPRAEQGERPVRYAVEPVPGALAAAIEQDFSAKYQDIDCLGGIGELLAA